MIVQKSKSGIWLYVVFILTLISYNGALGIPMLTVYYEIGVLLVFALVLCFISLIPFFHWVSTLILPMPLIFIILFSYNNYLSFINYQNTITQTKSNMQKINDIDKSYSSIITEFASKTNDDFLSNKSGIKYFEFLVLRYKSIINEREELYKRSNDLLDNGIGDTKAREEPISLIKNKLLNAYRYTYVLDYYETKLINNAEDILSLYENKNTKKNKIFFVEERTILDKFNFNLSKVAQLAQAYEANLQQVF